MSTSAIIDLDEDDIDPVVSQEAERAILDLVQAWPNLEYSLSEWLMSLANLAPDIGRIIIGNMDTKTKIGRLVMLSGHLKKPDEHEILKIIRSTHQKTVDIRNTVFHDPFLGMRKSRPHCLLFGGKRHMQGDRRRLLVRELTVKQLHGATEFAFKIDVVVGTILRTNNA